MLHVSKNCRVLGLPGRMYNSHDEHKIADHVVGFQVRSLDWRCLDLAISAFEKLDITCLETLHLYSSGKRAAVSHWLSDQGIKCLPRVSTLFPILHSPYKALSNDSRS